MARFGLFEQYFDSSGDPLLGGKLYVYESGTTTPKDTYADVGYTTPNTNPIVLGADGRMPDVFFAGEAKIVLTDADDVQIAVLDPIGGESLSAAEVLALYESNPDTNQYTDNDAAVVAAVDGWTYDKLTSGLESTDEILVNDGGTKKAMDISVLQAYLEANLGSTKVVALTGSGTWTHPADLNDASIVYVTACGGGGGGGNGTDYGGGGGAAFCTDLPVVLSGASTSYSVGAGGGGKAAGSAGNGSAGGGTQFGDLYLAGGSPGTSGNGGDGGAHIPVGFDSETTDLRDSAGSYTLGGAGGDGVTTYGTMGMSNGHIFGGGGGGGPDGVGGASGASVGGDVEVGGLGSGAGGASLGAGGDGTYTSAVGGNGVNGGGGGGSFNQGGGDGGDGVLIIRYVVG